MQVPNYPASATLFAHKDIQKIIVHYLNLIPVFTAVMDDAWLPQINNIYSEVSYHQINTWNNNQNNLI